MATKSIYIKLMCDGRWCFLLLCLFKIQLYPVHKCLKIVGIGQVTKLLEVTNLLEVCLGSLSCWNIAMWPKSPKGGDNALLQYVTVHVGIHGSLNEL